EDLGGGQGDIGLLAGRQVQLLAGEAAVLDDGGGLGPLAEAPDAEKPPRVGGDDPRPALPVLAPQPPGGGITPLPAPPPPAARGTRGPLSSPRMRTTFALTPAAGSPLRSTIRPRRTCSGASAIVASAGRPVGRGCQPRPNPLAATRTWSRSRGPTSRFSRPSR